MIFEKHIPWATFDSITIPSAVILLLLLCLFFNLLGGGGGGGEMTERRVGNKGERQIETKTSPFPQ